MKAPPEKFADTEHPHLRDADLPYAKQHGTDRNLTTDRLRYRSAMRRMPPSAGRHAEGHEQAGDERDVENQFQLGGHLDHGEVPSGIFEHHGFVHHCEFKVCRRIVHWDAGILSQCHDDQRHQSEARDTRTVTGAEIRNSATSGSRVVPADSAIVKTTSSIAGSASVAIIISREEPMPPKLVPTSMPASASRARAAPRSATSATASAAQLNMRPEANVGMRAAATQVKARMA